MTPAPGQLALFLAASLALTLTPGPAVLFIVARSMGQGRRAGLLSVAGIGLGNAVHAAATSLGLAALLASSPLAFAAVRWAGGAYLVVLGVRRLLQRDAPAVPPFPPGDPPGDPPATAPARPGGARPGGVLRQAFLVAVLNPKTALFFLAFLPQFADPRAGSLPAQLLLLGALFIAVAVATDSAYALAAAGLGRFLGRHPGFAAGERWVSGAVFVGLGLLAALAGP
jgi:threonine/homoserine/homoserine lactone efflux protein